MKKFSEGAESCVYLASFMEFDGVVKRRLQKNYRIKEIDSSLRIKRTKNEARIMGLVSSFGINSPKVLLVDKYDIFMSHISGQLLNDMLNSKNKTRLSLNLFRVLGKYAAILHNNNIVHGDYTPANVIVSKSEELYLIDFGLSEVTASVEEKALDILLMERSIDKRYFSVFVSAYKRECKEAKLVLNRLEEIEKRGRYNTRTLLTIDLIGCIFP